MHTFLARVMGDSGANPSCQTQSLGQCLQSTDWESLWSGRRSWCTLRKSAQAPKGQTLNRNTRIPSRISTKLTLRWHESWSMTSVMIQEVSLGTYVDSEGVCITPVEKNSLVAVFCVERLTAFNTSYLFVEEHSSEVLSTYSVRSC